MPKFLIPINAIVAVDLSNGIGNENELLCSLKKDMKQLM